MRPINYTVLSSTDSDEISSKVNELISDKWIPQGGISVHTITDQSGNEKIIFSQAMIKNN